MNINNAHIIACICVEGEREGGAEGDMTGLWQQNYVRDKEGDGCGGGG